MLHDDALPDGLACVITDISLMKWMDDVAAGGREVGEVRHHHEVEVVTEVTSIVAAGHGEQFGYRSKCIERVPKCLLCRG